MARQRGDHEARRRDVSAAVWRVLAARGFAGLTMRAVAAELGATTGVLTHYFADKQALTTHAFELLERTVTDRPRDGAPPGLAALRSAVLAMLPLDDVSREANRVWVASWDVALADTGRRDEHAGRYARGRVRLAELVRGAQHAGDVVPGDPDRVAARLTAFALGLAVQAVLDPAAFPPARQVELVDDVLLDLSFARNPGPQNETAATRPGA